MRLDGDREDLRIDWLLYANMHDLAGRTVIAHATLTYDRTILAYACCVTVMSACTAMRTTHTGGKCGLTSIRHRHRPRAARHAGRRTRSDR